MGYLAWDECLCIDNSPLLTEAGLRGAQCFIPIWAIGYYLSAALLGSSLVHSLHHIRHSRTSIYSHMKERL
jgi:hypothetical protein